MRPISSVACRPVGATTPDVRVALAVAVRLSFCASSKATTVNEYRVSVFRPVATHSRSPALRVSTGTKAEASPSDWKTM